jgi:hypothetical protein
MAVIKVKVLFYVARAYGIPVIQPMLRYIREQMREEVDVRFFLSKEVYVNKPDDWPDSWCLHSVSEAKGFRPDAVMCTGNYVDFRIPGLKVQLFHGVGIEKASHFKIRHFFDLYCTSGPLVTERFLKARDHYGYFDVAETGWPKYDHILSDAYRGGVGEEKPITILYAPTFSRRLQSSKDLLGAIQTSIRPHEQWVMKCHELMRDEWIEPYRKMVSPYFKLDYASDITSLLHRADVLISDTSSVIYEFLALHKPVITYRTTGSTHKGLHITDPKELRWAVDYVLENPGEVIQKGLMELNKVNPYLDGKCAERVMFEVIKRVKDKNFNIKKKPFNGIRKAKVWWNAMYHPGFLH